MRTTAPSDGSGTQARSAAIALLEAVLGRRRTLEEALDALPRLEPRDRGFAHLLAATVLRRLGTLDALIEPFLRRAPPDAVRHALRLGAAQLLLLGTPPHAAVGATVAAVRALPKGTAFTGLANAVLRRLATEGVAALDGLDAPRLDTPDWLWRSWHDAYGAETARAIATAHQREAPLDLTLKPGEDASVWAERLGAEVLPTGSLRLTAEARVPDLPGFVEGAWWVQDAAAALPARLLAVRPGERVIDLCAAPGGKTAQLAAAGARVTAVERAPDRAARLRENLTRLRLDAEVIEADAATWRPPEPADAVLLDAPCTATGTIRRHPDILRNKRASDVASLTAVQDAMLANAAAMLRPGGRLIYAVCSLQPEEGEGAIARSPAPLRRAPIAASELPGLPEAITSEGVLRTTPALWPARGGMDGFFAARMIRT
ncbi:RsmB/NOP family class I SAM-dependent RNA methyltransferase [Elioraea tepidiphila]|jgi:16S rRNA (cytosine967-C5)-methyltransferase|uniref:RsmB/NOP family class I SAM-dependent RNA methyltransferase n=1 Tax=Elioraea tepidiphila TaxID=457934 RepID=UPI0004B78BE3|nr:RsmB/NOP family class I SAM-dependent RNA methyltransferase [Elioraea tepidiphila]